VEWKVWNSKDFNENLNESQIDIKRNGAGTMWYQGNEIVDSTWLDNKQSDFCYKYKFNEERVLQGDFKENIRAF